jgi:superfamily II DNA/RNA helicase
MQAIPIGLTRKDMVALAPTGEGKTLAYLIPLIHFVLPLERLNSLNSETGPYGIVFVPSRELA